MDMAADVGAESYMLVEVQHEQDRNLARIVASNWIHDAIELTGREVLASLAQASIASAPGARPNAIEPAVAPALPGIAGGSEVRLLDILGHREIFSMRLQVGRRRYFLLLSSSAPGSIDMDAIGAAQIRTSYALSRMPSVLASATAQAPLSERERECLNWVSEGKTTEEVAMIVGVSANTVTTYVTHAIHKLSASNRAMAIATAIRSGII